MAQYIFGGNTGETPQSIADKRRMADLIMGRALQSGTPKTIGDGLTLLGNSLSARWTREGADEAQASGEARFADRQKEFLASLISGGNPGPYNSGGVAPGSDFLSALVDSESGGDWNALNSGGYGGRAQFGDARLADAAAAGVIPAGMTGADFSMMSPEVQQAVEQWHFGDIDQQAANMGLNQYFGQTIGGVPINADSIRAMAHLGGIGGAQQFITSGGQYNPVDSNGTRLSDYGTRFGGGGSESTPGQASLQPAPSVDPQRMQAIFEVLSDPFGDQGTKAIAMQELQRIQQQQSPGYQQQMRQADLDYQMGEARLAAMNGPNWQTIQTGDGNYYRYDANDPNSSPSLWFDAPALAAGSGNLGTTVYTGRDAAGNIIPMQVGPNGSFVPTALPDGVSFDPGAMNAERAAGNIVGRGAGQAALDLPGAATEVQRITTQIADLKAHPGLDEVFGNLFGWSPIPNQWAPTLPNTDKASALARIDQMSGNAFLNGRALLKGQGQITDFESRKAENAFARLSTAQTKEEFMGALDEFQQALEEGYAKIAAHAQGTQFSAGGSPDSGSPPAMGADPLGLF